MVKATENQTVRVWVSLFTNGDDWSALVAEAEGNEGILKSIVDTHQL